jgi:HAD superfamily hydrolase (TIGR01484 family)
MDNTLASENAIPPLGRENLPIDYQDSVVVDKLDMQLRVQGDLTAAAVFTDIDGTYLGQSNDPHEVSAFRKATLDMESQLAASHIPLIAVTGRELYMVQDMQSPAPEALPKFDIVVAAVGTEIHILQKDGSYKKDEQYQKFLQDEIGFDRVLMYEICKELKSSIATQKPELSLDFQPLDSEVNVEAYENDPEHAQEKTGQGKPQGFKISFRFNASHSDRNWVADQFRTTLDRGGFEKVLIVISHDSSLDEDRIRYNIDIIPVTKDAAIEYLVQTLKCEGVVAGDSGNDQRMIENATDAGIVVGGAKQELVDGLRKHETVRETDHFRVLSVDGKNRLIYEEPDEDLKASRSLKKALRAFSLLRSIRTSSEESST